MRKNFLYLANILLFLEIIFPAYVSQAIGFDIGDILEWTWGLQVIIPRDPLISRIRINFIHYILPWAINIVVIALFVTIFIEIKKYDQKRPSLRYTIINLAVILFIISFLYYASRIIIIPIALNLGLSGSIITIISNLKGKKEKTYNLKRVMFVEWTILIGVTIVIISAVLNLITFRNRNYIMILFTSILLNGGLYLVIIGGLIPIKNLKDS